MLLKAILLALVPHHPMGHFTLRRGKQSSFPGKNEDLSFPYPGGAPQTPSATT